MTGSLRRAQQARTWARMPSTGGTSECREQLYDSYTGANLAISAASLSVTADARSKTYGASDPALTYVASGLPNERHHHDHDRQPDARSGRKHRLVCHKPGHGEHQQQLYDFVHRCKPHDHSGWPGYHIRAARGQSAGRLPFTVSAASDSGLAVNFSSLTSSVCTVSGHTVTIIGRGTCTIEANQEGNGNYNAARR